VAKIVVVPIQVLLMACLLGLSAVADYGVLIFLRYLIRCASQQRFGAAALALIALSVVLAGLFWYLPFRASLTANNRALFAFCRVLSWLNVTDAVVLVSTFAAVGLLGVHHILWQLFLRPLYAVQRAGPTAMKWGARTLGLSLLTSGLAYGSKHLNPVWEPVLKLIGYRVS
jgi:hypothetical protein